MLRNNFYHLRSHAILTEYARVKPKPSSVVRSRSKEEALAPDAGSVIVESKDDRTAEKGESPNNDPHGATIKDM